MASLISEKDCVEILDKHLHGERVEIVNFKGKPFSLKNADSYALHYILEIYVKFGKNLKKHRFFVKQSPEKGTLKQQLVDSRKSFEKEESFYSILLPKLQSLLKETSQPYVAPQFLMMKENHVLVLEDLTVKFFVRAKRAYPMFLERIHLSLALDNLAKFHAASLALGGDFLDKHFKQFEVEKSTDLMEGEDTAVEKWFKASVKGIQTLLSHDISNDVIRDELFLKFNDYVEKCRGIMKNKTDHLKVLCHGQLSTKNILFKYEGNTPNQCVFVDFQQITYFYPAYDALLLIYLTTPQLFRQHYYTYLIKYYFDHLTKEIKSLKLEVTLSLEEFIKTVHYVLPLVKLQAALYFQENTGSREFHNKLQQRPRIFKKYFFQDKSDVSLELLRKDPNFRIIMNEAVNEIRELCSVPKIYRENCYDILENKFSTTIYDLIDYKMEKIGDEGNKYKLEIHVAYANKDLHLKYLVNCKESDGDFEVLREI